MTITRSFAAALGALAVLALAAAPGPMRGPGAVLDSARAILRAIEQGDGDALGKVLEPLPEERGLDYTFGADGEPKLENATVGIVFRDRDVAGKLVAVDTVAAAVKAMAIPREGVRIAHRILRVRADCPSSDCSWASIEFDREIHDGERVEVVPMTATMLCRYAADAPHMRVFVWHAAPRVSR